MGPSHTGTPVSFEIESATPGATRKLGERIGRLLRAGDVLLLSGELGAGKTVLAQGIGRGLGVGDPIKSSSFVIMNEYDGAALRLFHADLYRLEDPAQVAELALEELASAGVLVVEWPERASEEMPPEHLLVRLSYAGKGRRIEIEARGVRYEEITKKLERPSPSPRRVFDRPSGTALPQGGRGRKEP